MAKKLFSHTIEVLLLIIVVAYVVHNPKALDDFKNFFANSPVTPISLAVGIGFFIILLYLLRFFKSLLAKFVIGPLKIDAGLKNSIVSIIGYIGLFIIFMITASICGLKFEKLSWVLGGLSVGIGFGMQNIINNFISGIIILISRPLKIGDKVVIKGQEGIVKKINIRSTELETFTKATVLIPNADILSNDFVNCTHHDPIYRTDILVGVSYDADPHKVYNLLLDIAGKDVRVLQNPEPIVLFTEFGESSLNFELRVFSDFNAPLVLKTDLMFAVYDTFKKAHIEIPFPQRTLHLSKESLNYLSGNKKK